MRLRLHAAEQRAASLQTQTAARQAALKEKAELGLELENEHHAQLHFHQQALARALQAHRAARGEAMPAEWVVLRGPAARSQRRRPRGPASGRRRRRGGGACWDLRLFCLGCLYELVWLWPCFAAGAALTPGCRSRRAG